MSSFTSNKIKKNHTWRVNVIVYTVYTASNMGTAVYSKLGAEK